MIHSKYLQEQGDFMTGFAAQVASYDSSMLDFTELLRATQASSIYSDLFNLCKMPEEDYL